MRRCSLTADEWQTIGEGAVACPGWRWLPGMAWFNSANPEGWHGRWGALRGFIDSDEYSSDCSPGGELPDFTDPLTLWGLVALVREAWGPEYDVDVFTKANGSGTVTIYVAGHYVEGRFQDHDHIARALVRALEAAPVRPVPCKV